MMMARRRALRQAAGPGGVPAPRYPLSPGYPYSPSVPPGYWNTGSPQVGRVISQRRSRPVRAVARRGHRHRHVARPWILAGLAAAAGLAAHLVPPARSAWWLPLAAGVITGIRQWRKRVGGPRGHQIYAAACVATVAVWVAAVTRFGVTAGPGRLAVLALAVPGLWPLAWLWWQYHQVRPAGPAGPLPEPDPVALAWAAHVGAPGGPFPGTRLARPARSDGAAAYLITGVRGKHTTQQLTSDDAHAKIASALATDPDRIVLERPLPGPDRNGVNARLIVMGARNPQLKEEIPWTGPTLDKAAGTWQAAVYPDTPALCRLYQVSGGQPHRALNNAVAGLMGKGKSRFIDLSVAEMLWSGLFVVWYGDGQEGASAPGLRDHVDWYATRRVEVMRMVTAAWKVAKARQRSDETITWADSHGHQRTGRGFWPASPAEPFLQVILDEAQEMLNDARVAKLVRALQRLGPKVGVGVTLVTQEWLMFETGGSSGDPAAGSIRSFAQTGNVVLFKSGSDINANSLGGTLAGVNPRTLPDEPGWCYLLGPGTRPVPARMCRIGSDDLYHWLARAATVKARLDDLSARAAGQDYTGRWDRLTAATASAASGDILADLDSELADLLGGTQPAPGTTMAGLTIKQAVLEAVRAHGPIKRADIDSALAGAGRTASKSAIDQALASWRNTGHLISKDGGLWDTPDRDDRAATDAENRAAVVELAAHRDSEEVRT